MNRIPPKRAPKTNLALKFKALRLLCEGKTVEEIALIMGKCPRVIRRKLDWLKSKVGVYCNNNLIHLMHSHDFVFTCDRERGDYVEGDEVRRAA